MEYNIIRYNNRVFFVADDLNTTNYDDYYEMIKNNKITCIIVFNNITNEQLEIYKNINSYIIIHFIQINEKYLDKSDILNLLNIFIYNKNIALICNNNLKIGIGILAYLICVLYNQNPFNIVFEFKKQVKNSIGNDYFQLLLQLKLKNYKKIVSKMRDRHDKLLNNKFIDKIKI